MAASSTDSRGADCATQGAPELFFDGVCLKLWPIGSVWIERFHRPNRFTVERDRRTGELMVWWRSFHFIFSSWANRPR